MLVPLSFHIMQQGEACTAPPPLQNWYHWLRLASTWISWCHKRPRNSHLPAKALSISLSFVGLQGLDLNTWIRLKAVVPLATESHAWTHWVCTALRLYPS